jgi:broad specificity phosphatase PhoE
VLVTTHAGAIAQVVGHVEGITAARWESYRPANCSLTTVECDHDGTIRVVEFDRRIVADIMPGAVARRRVG